MSEIIRRPIDSSQIATSDPSSRLLYALSAGISLGLVLIGQGDKTGIDRRVDLLDFNLVDTLIQLIVGGSYDELGCRNSLFSKINKEAEKSAEHSSTSFEGRYINTVITCPAALLALTLIFIQTNDSSVLQKLPFPSNWYNLDYFQWDHILLLTISKNLIMWDSVQPSLEWVHEQVPSFLHELVEKENFKSKDCFQHAFQVYYSIIGGAYFAIGLRYAGSQDDRAKTVLVDGIKTWIEILESFKSSKRLRVVLEACVSISCVSLSLILAGSGDLEAFKLIRAILAVREGQESEASFGSFFALHESLGYLFLGGGTMTLKSDPLSIAYILIACFPFFPNYTSDNEQHLQALRHFFVLAVESRLLETRDCHSLELLSTPVQILTKDFNGMPRSVHQTTPVLLPKLSSIERIVLPGPSIFPTYVNVAESFSCAARCITVYVKKRNFRPITLAPTFHQKMIYRVCRSAQKESLIERLLILSDFQENSLEKFTLQLSWDLSITHAYFSSGACSIPDPKISRVITSTRSQFLKLLLAEFERRLMTILNVEDISLLYRDIILVIIFIRSHHILEIHSFCFSAAYLSFWGYL